MVMRIAIDPQIRKSEAILDRQNLSILFRAQKTKALLELAPTQNFPNPFIKGQL
jgi:hypothetical protein